jgi:uncharacterized membrane protein YqjE
MSEAEESATQATAAAAAPAPASVPADADTAVSGVASDVMELVAAVLALARLEAARAARGLLWALLLGVTAAVLVTACLLLVVALLLLGLLHVSGSLALALAMTIVVLLVATWLSWRGLRRVLRPLSLPATRAELRALLEPLRGKPSR